MCSMPGHLDEPATRRELYALGARLDALVLKLQTDKPSENADDADDAIPECQAMRILRKAALRASVDFPDNSSFGLCQRVKYMQVSCQSALEKPLPRRERATIHRALAIFNALMG